jgi:DNA repair exonuclease SbcCD ATPase subunit
MVKRSFIIILSAFLIVGCASFNEFSNEFDRKVEKGYVEIKDVEKRYNDDVKQWYKDKKEFYKELKDSVYPKIVQVVRDNWSKFTDKEQEILLDAREKAEKLDKKLQEMDEKLQEYDQKLQNRVFDRVDQAYSEYKKIRKKKEDIQDAVDAILDGASVINN